MAGKTAPEMQEFWDAAKYIAPKSLRRAGDFREEIIEWFYPSAESNQGQPLPWNYRQLLRLHGFVSSMPKAVARDVRTAAQRKERKSFMQAMITLFG